MRSVRASRFVVTAARLPTSPAACRVASARSIRRGKSIARSLRPGDVGALDVAELALEALVDDLILLRPGEPAGVLVVVAVDEFEQRRERAAELRAQTAPVADVEDPCQLLADVRVVEVLGVMGVVGDRHIAGPPRRAVGVRPATYPGSAGPDRRHRQLARIPGALSYTDRDGRRSTGRRCWRAWRDEQFDVLVIGGGITGVGTALDAASRGLRTALVERRRLRRRARRRRAPSSSTAGCATSSRATSGWSTRRSPSGSGCGATPRTSCACSRS